MAARLSAAATQAATICFCSGDNVMAVGNGSVSEAHGTPAKRQAGGISPQSPGPPQGCFQEPDLLRRTRPRIPSPSMIRAMVEGSGTAVNPVKTRLVSPNGLLAP